MQLERIALSFIIPHGFTDVFVFPMLKTIKIYSLCMPVLFLNKRYRIVTLIAASVAHISKDVGKVASFLLHILICRSKSLALIYFSCVHTLLHYKRTIAPEHLKIAVVLLGFTSCISYLYMDAGNSFLSRKIGEFWWVSLILGHVTINML